MADESKIVAAVGTASSVSGTATSDLAQRIEAAMTQAISDALAEGIDINDADEIKQRMMTAREAVLNAMQS